MKVQKPQHQNTVEFQVSGDYAMFADPITRVGGEKNSYMIPTYEALKGILHSIFWKPTITWIVDEVRIMHPIRTEAKAIRPIKMEGGNDLAYYTYLQDVVYQVRAHFEFNKNRSEFKDDWDEKKYFAMANRMIKRGGRRDIFLGTRECQGYVEPCVFGSGKGYYDHLHEKGFGFLYHGMTYPDEAMLLEDKGMLTTRFWTPVMKHGIIQFCRPEECTMKRQIRPMEMKRFPNRREEEEHEPLRNAD